MKQENKQPKALMLAAQCDPEDAFEVACSRELQRLHDYNTAMRIALENLAADIEALPTRSDGYPPYQHSPDWMRQQAADIVRRYLGEKR